MPTPNGRRPARESTAEALIRRINRRDAHLAVIGLGYVGLPLAVEFAKAGFRVTGSGRGYANAREREIDEVLLRLDPTAPPTRRAPDHR